MKILFKNILIFIGLKKLYKKISLYLVAKNNLKKSDVNKNLHNRVLKIQEKIKKDFYRHKIFPKLSLIVTSYNHSGNVVDLHKSLRKTNADEIIVCDDGSIDGANQKWKELLDRPNEYLYSSNENHEGMIIDRAFLSSRAEILCILQDDDIPPLNDEWVLNALNLFKRYPDLVILGANGGNILDRKDNTFENYNSYGYSPEIRDLTNRKRDNKIKKIHKGIKHENINFMFIHAVNIGPLFIRKNFYLESGGYKIDHIGIGNTAIFMDWEMCLNAWKMNKCVALYKVKDFKRRVGGSRQQVFQLNNRIIQSQKNKKFLEENYSFEFLNSVLKKIDNLNNKLDDF